MATASVQDRIIIGVDEAGYGPTIGPLVIAASAWRIPAEMTEIEFACKMSQHFLTRAWCEDCQHVPLGDSKQLYSPSVGLGSLEAGLLSMLAQVIDVTGDFAALLNRLTSLDRAGCWNAKPGNAMPGDARPGKWYERLPTELPVTTTGVEIVRMAAIARQRLVECNVELLKVQALVIDESQFNGLIDRFQSKGRLLSTVTMELVTGLLADYDDRPTEVFCDRQGGRKRYACVLLESMPDEWFDILDERPERSSYRRLRRPELKFHFSVGGDSFPPTALASMTAKYLRERLMSAINLFWAAHIDGLRPTAGYPLDAKRFREQIAPVADQLGFAVEDWWRAC